MQIQTDPYTRSRRVVAKAVPSDWPLQISCDGPRLGLGFAAGAAVLHVDLGLGVIAGLEWNGGVRRIRFGGLDVLRCV